MHDARVCDSTYAEVTSALTGPLAKLPLLTIFGERNRSFGFQPHWKQLSPTAQQVIVPKENHFPMCDDPDLVANTIREWHGKYVANNLREENHAPQES
jgi:pimeloyl-ACP methyl ester carboxylesterase